MTSLGRRQAVSQRLLVPSFHRFESCRPSITKEFSENNRKLFFFTLKNPSWVDRIRNGVSVRKKCEQWRSIFSDSGTGGARKRTEAPQREQTGGLRPSRRILSTEIAESSTVADNPIDYAPGR